MSLRNNSWLIFLFLISCTPRLTGLGQAENKTQKTGTAFYKQAMTMQWKQRDSLALDYAKNGNLPAFIKKFVPVHLSVKDSVSHRKMKVTYYVTPDYFSVGTREDWARVPLTAIGAQELADLFNCFLPTRKMVNDIYEAAVVRLEPVPMYIHRDSTVTMWQHHLIIEGQRKARRGLIAGIKKDVVISGKILRDSRPNRIAIYGWHKPDGKPIQPLYTGHVNWYADYSHGIRLVYRKIKVDGKWIDYEEVFKDSVLRPLICDEEWCDFYRY